MSTNFATNLPLPENEINRVMRANALTDMGRDWLKAATDPFHDGPLTALKGYPDREFDQSVVQTFTQRISVSKSTSLLPNAGPWDCHIVLYPLYDAYLNRTVSFATTWYGGGLSSAGPFGVFAGGARTLVAPLTVYQNYAGQAIDLSGVPVTHFATPLGVSGGGTIPPWPNRRARVIAAGFEVINTTPQLYRGGSVTGWYQAESSDECYVSITGGAPNAYSRIPCRTMALPPLSVGQAANAPWSVTRAADEGAYVVARLRDQVPFAKPTYGQLVWMPTDMNTTTPPTCICLTPGGNGSATDMTGGWYSTSSTEPCGAIFAGLDQNATLTITVRWIVEQVIPADDVTLFTLSSPSPPWDPVALESYSIAKAAIPALVPVDLNWNGNFFKSILTGIKKGAKTLAPVLTVVSDVAGRLPGPQAQAISQGAKVGANVAKKVAGPGRKKKPPKKEPVEEEGT